MTAQHARVTGCQRMNVERVRGVFACDGKGPFIEVVRRLVGISCPLAGESSRGRAGAEIFRHPIAVLFTSSVLTFVTWLGDPSTFDGWSVLGVFLWVLVVMGSLAFVARWIEGRFEPAWKEVFLLAATAMD
ncbi:MAG: hypothetical protein WBG86_23295 [Polyangiales bacterium]